MKIETKYSLDEKVYVCIDNEDGKRIVKANISEICVHGYPNQFSILYKVAFPNKYGSQPINQGGYFTDMEIGNSPGEVKNYLIHIVEAAKINRLKVEEFT